MEDNNKIKNVYWGYILKDFKCHTEALDKIWELMGIIIKAHQQRKMHNLNCSMCLFI